jgi:hypothetical protein
VATGSGVIPFELCLVALPHTSSEPIDRAVYLMLWGNGPVDYMLQQVSRFSSINGDYAEVVELADT